MSKMKMNKAPLNEIASPRFDVDKYSPEEKKEVDPQKRSAKKIRINKYMYSEESEEKKSRESNNNLAGESDYQVFREESRDDDDTMPIDYS